MRAFSGTGAVAAALLAITAPLTLLAGEEEAKLPRWKKGVQEGVAEIDGAEEAFVALVPKGYSPKKARPLVLLLHGNGGKARSFLNAVKPSLGKRPPLVVSLERCDNNQEAEGYCPKYLEALRGQFAIDDENVFALGFSGGGFRLWDDVVCHAEELPKFRGVILVGSAKQSFEPPEKPENAPSVVLVGDPKDSNFTEHGPAAEAALTEKGYEVFVLEHNAGHSMPSAEMKEVFAWIDAVIAGKKTKLETRRVAEDGKKKRR
jgi:predicted esterase